MLKVYGYCLERVWVEDVEACGVTSVWTVLAQALKIITNNMMNSSKSMRPDLFPFSYRLVESAGYVGWYLKPLTIVR